METGVADTTKGITVVTPAAPAIAPSSTPALELTTITNRAATNREDKSSKKFMFIPEKFENPKSLMINLITMIKLAAKVGCLQLDKVPVFSGDCLNYT